MHQLHSSRICIVCFFKIKKKHIFLRFKNDMSKKHRKRYQVNQIARTLAYTVRSETNTYTYNII